MDFLFYISTPTENKESNPKVSPLRLTKGRLTGGFLYFPSGPAGTLHFIARVGLHQILPFNPGENYRLNDCVIPFSLGVGLLEPPFIVDCITWNDSTDYPHALTVCFFLAPSGKKKFSLDRLKNAFSGTEGYSKP